ncbi:MAG: hypothetical protein JWN38_1094 [Candidatus Saccharibacteria bacterium]|nr:hypothetical protein [Candidatus Saccharibacteria bacterium]
MQITTYSDTETRIYEFLDSTPVGVLSSVTPDNDPYGAAIYFGIDKKFIVSVLTKSDTRKYDNLTHNRHVMLTVFDAITQTTVQLTGEAKEITDSSKINEIAQMNMKASMKTSDGGIPAISKIEAGAFVAFEIKPVLVRMAVYERPDAGGYDDLFESITKFELKDF